MKQATLGLISAVLLLVAFFIPTQQALVLNETRTIERIFYYIPIKKAKDFQVTFTHSIHLSDVNEFYKITQDGRIQFVKMVYEDLAVGMPGYAEENQTFERINGKWVLTSEDAFTDSFTLYNSSIHKKLELRYDSKIYDLKQQVPTGHSYRIEVAKLSIADVWKGEKIDGRE